MRTDKPSYVPAVVWLIISTILLTLPGSSFPPNTGFELTWADKLVHVLMFMIMVTVWCWGLLTKTRRRSRQKRLFMWMVLLWLAYGILMEFIQYFFTVNRSFELGDILADAAGCVLGYFFSYRAFIKKNRPL